MELALQTYNSVEAAKILNVNVSTIKRWTDEGKLECIKTVGGHRKFTMQNLTGFLQKHSDHTSKANLFPIESEEDLMLSAKILRGDYKYLVNYVARHSRLCSRDRIQRVFNGLYMAQIPLHAIYDNVVTPVLRQNGDLWMDGKLEIIEEHVSTQVIRDCLIRLQGSIRIPTQKRGTAFCMIMSSELHDIALKMVDHLLELKGLSVCFSGQMTPTIRIEKFFKVYNPQHVFISSTVVQDLNVAQAEFDKLCYIAEREGANVFVGGQGFNQIEHRHSAVVKRFYTFEELYQTDLSSGNRKYKNPETDVITLKTTKNHVKFPEN